MVSVLANSYDRHAKLLNGTHKSHVHSEEEVSLCPDSFFPSRYVLSSKAFPWYNIEGEYAFHVQARDQFHFPDK